MKLQERLKKQTLTLGHDVKWNSPWKGKASVHGTCQKCGRTTSKYPSYPEESALTTHCDSTTVEIRWENRETARKQKLMAHVLKKYDQL